jgi:hypothetical protein
LIAEASDFIRVRYRIHIHAVFGEWLLDAASRRVPQQAAGTYKNHLPWLCDQSAHFHKPIFNLMRIF